MVLDQGCHAAGGMRLAMSGPLVRFHRYEKGGGTLLVAIAIAFGLLFVAPFFLDFLSVHIVRRVAQTGTDAASLAAAKSYADTLSIPWEEVGECAEPEASVKTRALIRYLAFVAQSGASDGVGHDAAIQYAGRNNTKLIDYRPTYPSHTGNGLSVDGFWIPAINVFTRVEKPAPLMYRALYGRETISVPARAAADTYLKRYKFTSEREPCFVGKVEKVRFKVEYRFYWRIKLVEEPQGL